MKRIISIIIVALLICSACCVNGFAFGGYAHWEIARRAANYHNIPTGRNQDDAFMAGCLLADIGKSTWDNSYTTSDSIEFATKMMSISKATEQDSYFARGWQAHVYQDLNGSVNGILNDGDSYRVNCGQIDEYLRDELDIDCPINNSNGVYVCYDQIKNTYKALDNFTPTTNEIMQEIEDMYFLYNSQIALNFSSMSATQISNMNNQFNNLAQNCYSTSLLNSTTNNLSLTSNNNAEDSMELILAERKNPMKKSIAQSIEAQASDFAHLETISVDDNGNAFVRLVFDNEEAYFQLVEQHAALIGQNTSFTKS